MVFESSNYIQKDLLRLIKIRDNELNRITALRSFHDVSCLLRYSTAYWNFTFEHGGVAVKYCTEF